MAAPLLVLKVYGALANGELCKMCDALFVCVLFRGLGGVVGVFVVFFFGGVDYGSFFRDILVFFDKVYAKFWGLTKK